LSIAAWLAAPKLAVVDVVVQRHAWLPEGLWRKVGMARCRLIGNKCRSRHNEGYDTVVDDPAFDPVAGHRLNDRPFLPKESRRFVYV
jgi:hypothetical protein